MRRYGLAVVALCGMGMASFGGAASAQQFSADMVSDNGSQPPGRIYFSDGKIRMEQKGGRAGAVIVDIKAGTALILDPRQKVAISNDKLAQAMGLMTEIDPNNPCPQLQKLTRDMNKGESGQWSCKLLGPETVNGRAAVKFQVNLPDNGQTTGWIDTRLKVVIKSENAKGGGMEMRNIAEGQQPASLFEIPADYQKMDMSQMMQRLMNQQAKPGQGGGN